MTNTKLYVPFEKINAVERIVGGYFTSETPDAQGDILDWGGTKRAVDGYAQWRNVREMHQPSAVGVCEKLEADDINKRYYAEARIVDEDAWQKVQAGVYKGFSIGGDAINAVIELQNGKKVRRVTDWQMNELSIVDRPANPDAVFTLAKRDDSDDLDKNDDDLDKNDDEMEKDDDLDKSESDDDDLEKDDDEDLEKDDSDPDIEAITKAVLNAVNARHKTELDALTKRLDILEDLENRVTAAEAALTKVAKADRSATTIAKVLAEGALGPNVTKAVEAAEGAVSRVAAIEERLTKMEAMPVPGGPVAFPLEKGLGFAHGVSSIHSTNEIDVLEKMEAQATDPALKAAIQQRQALLMTKDIFRRS